MLNHYPVLPLAIYSYWETQSTMPVSLMVSCFFLSGKNVKDVALQFLRFYKFRLVFSRSLQNSRNHANVHPQMHTLREQMAESQDIILNMLHDNQFLKLCSKNTSFKKINGAIIIMEIVFITNVLLDHFSKLILISLLIATFKIGGSNNKGNW